jgi:ribonuclease P protein component
VVVRVLPAAAGRSYRELGADLDAALTAARRPRRGRETASREIQS